jgi:spermidine synthase
MARVLAERARALLTPRRLVQSQVFLAGAGVMALEMLGSRLLAPRFGSTIFTWGALIGVVMAALAAGYYLGGRLGDQRPRADTLAALLFGAGTFAVLLPLLGPPALAGVAAVLPDPRGGPLLASLLLLAPPSLLLGAATPVAVRLVAGPLEKAGSVAGSMAGLSTVGSIAGTFVTVFVLVPLWDVATILFAAGLLLGLASLLTAERRTLFASGLAVVVVLTPVGQGALAPLLTELATGISERIVHRASTPYHDLLVTEGRVAAEGPVRTLVLDGNRHSAMYLDKPAETPFRYVEFFHLGPLLSGNASRVLFVGAGGMSGPKQFLQVYPNATLDVVEIDGVVVEVARQYFAVPEDPRLRVHVQDARLFLQQSAERWDVVVLDAYGRSYVPFHLMTAEFHALVREHLAPGGVVVSNVIGASEGPASQLLRAEVRTMAASYGWVKDALTRPNFTPWDAQNVMVLAAAQEPPGWAQGAARAAAWQGERGRDYPALLGSVQGALPRTDDVPILTDGFAPVESYLSPLTMRPYDPEA